jgi:hypothetical protein
VPGLLAAGAAARPSAMAHDVSDKVTGRASSGLGDLALPGPSKRRRKRKGAKGGSGEGEAFVNFLKWLGTSLVGVCILAGVGVLMVCGGGSMWAFAKPETAPTKYTIAEIENMSGKPKEGWIEITDAFLYWDMMVGETTAPANKQITKSDIKYYYVPLVSTDVVQQWNAVQAGAQQGVPPQLPHDKARVYVKFPARELEKLFPSNVDTFIQKVLDPRPDTPFTPKGTMSNFSSIPDGVLKEMQKNWQGPIDKNRMILFNYEGKPFNPQILGVILLILGLGLFVPIGIWGVRSLAGGKRSRSGDDFEEEDVGPRRKRKRDFAEDDFEAAPTRSGPAAGAAPAAGATYFYSRQGQSHGPVSFAQLRQLAASGQLTRQDYVYDDNVKQWVPAANVPGLFG